MWETFQTNPGEFGMVATYSLIALAVVAAIGIKAWRNNEAGKRDAELKMEMIARGMSADEIERVLAAKSDDPKTAVTTYQKK
jgi:hypothetical protein